MNELKHYGVLGMRWGQRKSKPNSSDYTETRALLKKPRGKLTQGELDKIIARKELESKVQFGGLRYRKLSNDDIRVKLAQKEVKNIMWKKRTRLPKPLKDMSLEELNDFIKRDEKIAKIQKLQADELIPGMRVVNALFKVYGINAELGTYDSLKPDYESKKAKQREKAKREAVAEQSRTSVQGRPRRERRP